MNGLSQDAEDRYERAGNLLIKRRPELFAKYIRIKKHTQLDAEEKIDALLVTNGSIIVGFQYKTLWDNILRHYIGHEKTKSGGKHSHTQGCTYIMALAPPSPRASDEELSEQLEQAALEAINNPFVTPYSRYIKNNPPS